ncbi:MAG: oligosaccharide flippase family protein, partial [Desulfobacteraceae bacterium]|nr:oligosaccharide flippase family protein [Desulfobacteraceae bacterium]
MSRVSKNIIYNLVGQGILLVLGFVAVKYIFKQLGEDALGIIYFTAMMNAFLCVALEMGICSTIVREVSAHFQSEPDYIHDLIRTASFFYWGAYLLLGVAIFFLVPVLVEKWINLKTMDSETAIYVLRILGIASLVALPKSLYVSLFRGLQRMEFNNFIDVITSGLQQFGTILILALGGDLLHIVYWFAGCYGLIILTYFGVSARFFPLRAFVPGYSSTVVKRNLGFAFRMMFISITGTVHMQADKIIISKLLPIGIFGYYGVAYGSVSKGTLLTGAISQAAFPSFSDLFSAGDRKGLMAQYRKLQDLICFGIAPIFALIPFVILPLFSYMLNEDVARLLFLPTTLLCVGFYMNGTLSIPYVFSLAVGKPGIAARQHFYDLFVTLPATVLLVYYLDLVGAGLSLVLFYVFHYAYAAPRICSECF